MRIISVSANPSGAYPPPQSWDGALPPGGYAVIPDTLDLAAFYAAGGFVSMAFADGRVMSFTADSAAFERWKAANPALTAPPALEDRMAAAEAAITALMGV